jgi:molybdenum cofactor cytidylyltransferase
MPAVSTDTFQKLAGILTERPRAIVVPIHEGRDGHPVLFGARFFDDLLLLKGDAGGRSLIDANPDAVLRLAVDDPGILRDIDTQEDFTRHVERESGASDC